MFAGPSKRIRRTRRLTARHAMRSRARYLYTLELDSTGKIIGGEWHQNAHPDFLWLAPPGTRAVATGEPTGNAACVGW